MNIDFYRFLKKLLK